MFLSLPFLLQTHVLLFQSSIYLNSVSVKHFISSSIIHRTNYHTTLMSNKCTLTRVGEGQRGWVIPEAVLLDRGGNRSSLLNQKQSDQELENSTIRFFPTSFLLYPFSTPYNPLQFWFFLFFVNTHSQSPTQTPFTLGHCFPHWELVPSLLYCR